MDPHLVQLSTILMSSLLVSWLARLLKIPNILLMLVTGFLIGPVLNWVDPKQLFGNLLLPFVSISVAVILFEGGLTLRLKKTKKIGPIVLPLVFLSILLGIPAGLAFMHFFLGYPIGIAMILATILLISGPTVIIPLLHQLHIKDPVRSILRWEAILIDPIGAVSAVLLYEAFFLSTHNSFASSIAYGLFLSFFVAAGIGFAFAQLLLLALRRYLIPELLHNPVVLLALVASFMTSNAVQEDSGLVAVTVMGIVLANQSEITIRHIVAFKENLRVILIAFLFVTLAATIDLKAIKTVWTDVAAILAFLLLIFRPLTVLLSTWHSNLKVKEKLFLAIVAPRGIVSAAVASLFALRLSQLGYPEGSLLTPVVFSVIAATVLISGIGSALAAPLFGLTAKSEAGVLIVGANALARAVGKALLQQGFKPLYIDTDFWKTSQARRQDADVFYGSFLVFQEAHEEEMEGSGLVLALTENDDINSLAINHFSHYFTQDNLYQIRPDCETIPEHLTGRLLFPEKCTQKWLREQISKGATVKAVSLTKEYGYSKWTEDHGENGCPLFYLSAPGVIHSITDPQSLVKVRRGILIYLLSG